MNYTSKVEIAARRAFFAGAFIFLAGILATAPGCGHENLSYKYEVNGCSTGDRSFDSKEAYCSGLQDSKANNGCAAEMRAQTYQRDCGGTFSET